MPTRKGRSMNKLIECIGVALLGTLLGVMFGYGLLGGF